RRVRRRRGRAAIDSTGRTLGYSRVGDAVVLIADSFRRRAAQLAAVASGEGSAPGTRPGAPGCGTLYRTYLRMSRSASTGNPEDSAIYTATHSNGCLYLGIQADTVSIVERQHTSTHRHSDRVTRRPWTRSPHPAGARAS